MVVKNQNMTVNFVKNKQVDYTIQRTNQNGIDYIIIPSVMMKDGVHNGSAGPTRHTIQELGRDIDSWNGILVMINHPEIDGSYVSAETEGIRDHAVGEVRNTRVEEDRLRADLYIDEQKLMAESTEAHQSILNNIPLDVSVGVFNRTLEEEGSWNGEQYERIAVDYTPDHLALLPSGTGACSWVDGCGIRTNQEDDSNNQKTNDMTKKKINVKKEDNEEITPCNYIKSYTREKGRLFVEQLSKEFEVNKMGYQAIMSNLQAKLDAMDTPDTSYFLEEVYENDFIYRVSYRAGQESTYFKRSYTVSDDGTIEITGESAKVTKEVNYNNFINVNNEEKNIMNEKKKDVKVLDKVDELISNENTHFTANDKDWLSELTVNQLTKLEPKKIETTPVKEQLSGYTEPEKVIKELPEGMKKIFQSGLDSYKKNKETLVKTIQDNTADGIWKKEDLNKMEDNVLENLAKSVAKEDYTVNGHSPEGGGGDDCAEKPELPVGIEPEKN